ncbi:hypothetical protein PR003_g32839 [Phytophthora rubi]|uniref:Uncharacterized protein n=1 Tax=Phytophthora rubi TaxID=129364 RepID=A0A6A4AXC8_9STRA|nr:hypothetical protein PR003_g32839 [Phytophthora rubi]
MLRFLAVVRSVAPAPWAGWFLTTNPLPSSGAIWGVVVLTSVSAIATYDIVEQ